MDMLIHCNLICDNVYTVSYISNFGSSSLMFFQRRLFQPPSPIFRYIIMFYKTQSTLDGPFFIMVRIMNKNPSSTWRETVYIFGGMIGLRDQLFIQKLFILKYIFLIKSLINTSDITYNETGIDMILVIYTKSSMFEICPMP